MAGSSICRIVAATVSMIAAGFPWQGLAQAVEDPELEASCNKRRNAIEVESFGWPGGFDEINKRIARERKALYEGPCARSVYAKSVIEGANNILNDVPTGYVNAWDQMDRARAAAKAAGKAPANVPPSAAPRQVASASAAPASGLSQQQISACSQEIQRTQVESQRWPGNVNDNAARLGRFQKELFEGRCAGHPEAQAYIAGANRMLGYGGNPNAAGAGSNTGGSAAAQRPLASAPSASPVPPDRERTRKVNNPAADARGCVQLSGTGKAKGVVGSGWQLTNNCGVPVEGFWCIVNAAGQCRSAGSWSIRPGGTWPIQEEGNIRWGACKGRNGGGFDDGTNGTRYTCHLLNW